MAKVTINVKADKDVKAGAQKVAQDLGIPLSAIINAYLRQFVRTKEIHFVVEGELKPAAKRRLARLQKEVEEGNNLSPEFPSAEAAIRHLASG